MSEIPVANPRALARAATAIENETPEGLALLDSLPHGGGLLVGITGPPGAGKSTLVGALAGVLRERSKTVGIVAVDPSSRATGGAILGDRIRMQERHGDPGIFIRSMATRGSAGGLARATAGVARLLRAAGFDYVIVETVGVGQDEIEIAGLADVTVVVLVPGMGDDVQTIKAGIMEIADIFVINKADQPGAERAEREIRSMLGLSPRKPRPAIVKTVATDGTGVADLLDAIESWPRRAPIAAAPSFAIDHLGIAVRSIEGALGFYQSQLGMAVASVEDVPAENVRAAMLPAGTSRLELLESADPDSAIGRFLAKRGEGLHHVALRVPDLAAAVGRLRSSGARILNEPRRGAGGHLYVFVHPDSTGGVLLELIQG